MFGEYAAFIVPAYLITFVALGITTGFIALRYRQRKAEADFLKEKRHQAHGRS